MLTDYTSRLATTDDLPLLAQWLAVPDVQQWWGEPVLRLGTIRDHIVGDEVTTLIINYQGVPLAYVQHCDLGTEPHPSFAQLPPTTQFVDTFIGDPAMMNRGHGAAYLRQIAEQLLAAGAPLVAIDPAPENLRARRAYARAGFVGETIVDTDDGPAVLMFFRGTPATDEEEGATLMATPTTKAAYLAELTTAHDELQAALAQWTPQQLTGPTDAAGWTINDHLLNLNAWEHSVVSLLNHQPRHEGLGVPEALYLAHDTDAINAAILKQNHHYSPAEAQALFADTHQQLLNTLTTLTDDDLQQTYTYYLPDEPGDDDGTPILARLRGNTSEHYREHLPWMQAIAAGTNR